MYCTLKIHKPASLLRPIIDYTGATGYNVSRFLVDILGPLVRNTDHHVKNSRHLAEELQGLRVEEGYYFYSHGVVSLFMNMPITRALEVIKHRLVGDIEDLEEAHEPHGGGDHGVA